MAQNPNKARITLNPEGPAQLYQDQPLPGYSCKGTVSQSEHTGALCCHDLTGIYVMANAGIIRALNQRKVLTALGIGLGRPKEMPDGHRRNVYMNEADAKYLREIGGGNLSEGLRIVVNAHRESDDR